MVNFLADEYTLTYIITKFKYMRAAVIINEEAGQGSGRKQISEYLTDADFPYDIFAISGENLPEILGKISDEAYEILIAAGGDGTVSAVAEKAVELKRIMGIIPSGTLNHFAKDAGIPLNSGEAVKVLLRGQMTLIDTASVNDHTFLNNSSIGLYPRVVKHREEQMKFGGNKWSAMLKATMAVLRSIPKINVAIKADGSMVKCKTPFVFIGNNSYKFDLFNLGIREGLNDGRLSIYYPKIRGRFSYIRLIIKALLGRLDQEENFQILHKEEIIIYSTKKKLEVSIDGEVVKLETPLRYKINPSSLRLIIPA